MTSNLQLVQKEEELIKKGFTGEEARLLAKWIEEGKPGLAKSRAENVAEIYMLGYTCQEINKWFPEYPLEVLLYARLQYKWDEARALYQQTVYEQTVKAAITTRLESLRFLSDYLAATNKKWRKEMMEYLNNPDAKEAPDFLPKNIHVYSQALAMFENMLKIDKKTGKDANPLDGMPLVSINVNNSKEKDSDVIVGAVSPSDIKKALSAELKKKKDG